MKKSTEKFPGPVDDHYGVFFLDNDGLKFFFFRAVS